MEEIYYPGGIAFFYAVQAAETLTPLELYKSDMKFNDIPLVSDDFYNQLLSEYEELICP